MLTPAHSSMPDILWLPQSAVLAKVSPNAATVCAYNLTSEETQHREGKHTYVTSTDQDDRHSPLSSNLSEQNLLWPNNVTFECLQDLYWQFLVSSYTSSLFTRKYLTIWLQHLSYIQIHIHTYIINLHYMKLLNVKNLKEICCFNFSHQYKWSDSSQ
jgi:hypothetical protein